MQGLFEMNHRPSKVTIRIVEPILNEEDALDELQKSLPVLFLTASLSCFFFYKRKRTSSNNATKSLKSVRHQCRYYLHSYIYTHLHHHLI